MDHGLLLIDKPSGMTSHDVVAKVRRWIGSKAVGHAGTLDPLATGLMVVLLGEATKISDYLLTGDKGYRVKVRFGIETDSLDITGQTLKKIDNLDLNKSLVESTILSLQGPLILSVPRFSAVKVKGETLLQKTLKEKEFLPPEREMSFYDLKLLEISMDSAICEFRCSKGSYVRSWVQKLGELLGCGATVEELRRFFSSPYSLAQAIQLEDLLKGDMAACGSSFVPLSECLLDWEAFTVIGKEERLMTNGQIPNELSKRLIFQQKMVNKSRIPRGVRIFQGSSGRLSSLVEIQPCREPKIKRVFRY